MSKCQFRVSCHFLQPTEVSKNNPLNPLNRGGGGLVGSRIWPQSVISGGITGGNGPVRFCFFLGR